MDFARLIMERESVRKYNDRPVEKEKIERIMESCRMAPSACNSQPWRFVVVTDPDLKNQVARATTGPATPINRFAPQAPVIVALVAEPPNWLSKIGSSIKDKDYYLMDIGIVADHFCLQAADLGLGSCMIGWFDEKKVRELLQIPKKRRIPRLITLGYPANETPRKKIRKTPEKLYRYNRY